MGDFFGFDATIPDSFLDPGGGIAIDDGSLEDTDKDAETFGDIGPLTDDWEKTHENFAAFVEGERGDQLSDDETPFEEDMFHKAITLSDEPFFSGDYDEDDNWEVHDMDESQQSPKQILPPGLSSLNNTHTPSLDEPGSLWDSHLTKEDYGSNEDSSSDLSRSPFTSPFGGRRLWQPEPVLLSSPVTPPSTRSIWNTESPSLSQDDPRVQEMKRKTTLPIGTPDKTSESAPASSSSPSISSSATSSSFSSLFGLGKGEQGSLAEMLGSSNPPANRSAKDKDKQDRGKIVGGVIGGGANNQEKQQSFSLSQLRQGTESGRDHEHQQHQQHQHQHHHQHQHQQQQQQRSTEPAMPTPPSGVRVMSLSELESKLTSDTPKSTPPGLPISQPPPPSQSQLPPQLQQILNAGHLASQRQQPQPQPQSQPQRSFVPQKISLNSLLGQHEQGAQQAPGLAPGLPGHGGAFNHPHPGGAPVQQQRQPSSHIHPHPSHPHHVHPPLHVHPQSQHHAPPHHQQHRQWPQGGHDPRASSQKMPHQAPLNPPPESGHRQQPALPPSPYSQDKAFSKHLPPYRRWKEPKSWMQAEEIDNIIKVQYAQIQSPNPYVDDYYYQSFINKHKDSSAAKDLHANVPAIPPFRKPISEAFPPQKPQARKSGVDPMAGVLGRIPSHSVRAPRPLIQLRKDGESIETMATNFTTSNNSVLYSILVSIENSFNLLLELEDIELVLQSCTPPTRDGVNYLSAKRSLITEELFASLKVGMPNSPLLGPGSPVAFKEDKAFSKILSAEKGRKLLARAVKVLPPRLVFLIILFFLRNMHLLILPEEFGKLEAVHSQLMGGLSVAISSFQLQHLIMCTQHLLHSLPRHPLLSFVKLLREPCLVIFRSILARAREIKSQQAQAQGQPNQQQQMMWMAWHNTFDQLFAHLFGHLDELFDEDSSTHLRTWDFLTVLALCANERQKHVIVNELRTRMKSALESQSPPLPLQYLAQLLRDAIGR